MALGAAVGLPVLAARAVLAGVEQHPVVTSGVAALLTLGQATGQQPAHRVGDRATGAQLLVQAPHQPPCEHLRGVRTAREALHPGQFAAGGGLHQAAVGRTIQPRHTRSTGAWTARNFFGDRGTLLPRCCLPWPSVRAAAGRTLR
ncbi:hypothetical protein VR44_38690 [Streptomyces katrae]|uniref:Uncharacterized protein n=1 Tax=Streptomyces katrae TaxID=68223 RepID=A0A0F4IIJ2_9ACTN|nr:hypothetical protein VR44_38690 [Streptomyces katrae]